MEIDLMAGTGITAGRVLAGTPVAMDDGTTGYAQQVATASTSAGGAAANPSFTQIVGAGSFSTSQAVSSVSPAAALQVVAARAGRQAVTFTNTTGTQPVYFTSTASVTGVTTGYFLAGTVGASVTIATTAAVFATSPTAAQTLGVLEVF